MNHSLEGCTIAFDLDGTLVDTAPDLNRALNLVMRQEKLPEVALEDMRRFVGQGARALIARSAGAAGRTYDDPALDDLTRVFIDIYAADIAAGSTIFPGVEEALTQLDAAGARLCVCTNKKTSLAVQLLEELDLAPRFRAIIGADAVANRKPSADHYRHAIHAAGGQVDRSLMVGDSSADANAARNAGAPVILVTFGYTETPVEQLGATALMTHFDNLPKLAAALLMT